MTFSYVSTEEAIARPGLRMVVVGGVPSPSGEAAKGILHIKRIDWVAVRLAYDSEAQKAWAGQRSGPIAMYEDEAPRAGWREILELAERLAPEPALLPADADRSASSCSASRTASATKAASTGRAACSWSTPASRAAAASRAASPATWRRSTATAPMRAAAAAAKERERCSTRWPTRLKAQHFAGSPYFVGTALSAADVYAATAMGLFRPLAPEHCAMDAATRAAFETRDEVSDAALDPVLLAHRDMMYAKHLELPLSL